MFRAIILSSIFFLVSNVCLAQFSRNVIVSTGGLSLYEQLEKERIEAEKAAEAERIAQEEAEKKAAEQARIQAEQKAEADRLAAEEARIKAEKKAEEEKQKAAEAARIKAEQKAEADRLAAEEARIKAEKKAEEEKQKAEEREQKKQERKARIAAYPWSHMIMANAGISNSPDYAFGLTYAYVKHVGFYVSAMSNFGFKFNAKYDAQSDGSLYKTYEYPFYTGKTEYTRLEATVGGMVRMRIPLYAYAGVGYGYRGLYCEAINGEWVRIHNNSTAYHGAVVEAGLTGNIKGFLISAGYSVYISKGIYHQAKLGIGYCF